MAEKEWWLTGGEAARRLDALTDYWNALQNAALGRGVEPIAPMALADELVSNNEGFHRWRATLEGYTFVSSMADELEQWTRRANEFRVKLQAARVPALPVALTEWEQTGPTDLLATSVVGLGLALLLLYQLRR